MLDVDGNVLSDFPFGLSFFRETEPPRENPETDAAAFTLALPRPAGVALVQILLGEQVLFERPVSDAAPLVDFVAPAGGETWMPGDAVTLEWSAEDPDGDALTYVVSFSDDGGARWYPVALDLTEPRHAWTVPDIGTRQAMIRILAGDGVNTFEIASQPFTILGSGGQGLVASAGRSRQVKVGADVTLDATASRDSADLEAPLSYRWRLAGAPGTELVALSDPASPTPSFVPAVEGRYIFELTVGKGDQKSRPANVVITALSGEVVEPPPINIAPPAAPVDGEPADPLEETPLVEPMGCAPCGATPMGMIGLLALLLSNASVRRAVRTVPE
jgi:hypothetical protein